MNAVTKTKASEAQSLLGALAMALPSLEAAKKNAANPHFKSKYADLGSVIEAIRPISDYGLWFRQVSHETDSGVSVETFYIREGEELSAGKVFVPADRSNAQGYGSAQTYARRYGLQLAFGLATEDDDGNAASASPPRGAVRDKAGNGAVSPDGPMPDHIAAKIIQLCEAVGGNQSGVICNAYKVKQITDLSPKQADAVIERLEQKLAEKAKAETNEQAKENA